jgi:hypothetical protein
MVDLSLNKFDISLAPSRKYNCCYNEKGRFGAFSYLQLMIKNIYMLNTNKSSWVFMVLAFEYNFNDGSTNR